MTKHNILTITTTIFLVQLILTQALELDITSKESICEAAKAVQQGVWNYYEGFEYGGVLGTFYPPNYWWHAGEAWGGLVDYYTYCDNDNETLRQWIAEAMYHQRGEVNNYIPSNESMVEGNDDQGVWGMALMEAVERNFQDPEEFSWLELTQALFNSMKIRWDTSTCGGGLRWQIFEWNTGYDYKSTIANGCLFHLAARLARYTDDESDYLEIATKVWDWMEEVRYIDYYGNDDPIRIYDGSHDYTNCTDITALRWSSNYGTFLSGCAYMYNTTGDDIWKQRTLDILEACKYFYNDTDIMRETTCMAVNKCNWDQRSFRSIFTRFLALTLQLVPETEEIIRPLIEGSAKAAAQSCSGGSDGVTCGLDWTYDGWDGMFGLGEQTSALDTLNSLLVRVPLTIKTGGTTRVNYSAGVGTEENPAIKPPDGYTLTATTSTTTTSSSTSTEESSTTSSTKSSTKTSTTSKTSKSTTSSKTTKSSTKTSTTSKTTKSSSTSSSSRRSSSLPSRTESESETSLPSDIADSTTDDESKKNDGSPKNELNDLTALILMLGLLAA